MIIDNQNLSKQFVERIAALHFENTFNPYTDTCPVYDQPNATVIRRQNLERVLDAALLNKVDSIWIARDLGYRGGRRTGLALTDEVHLPHHAKLLGSEPLEQATGGEIMGERTAHIVWRALELINRPIFLWNVFPLHPHGPDEPMSNRCHTAAERIACQQLIVWLIQTLRPNHVVAIGRDSQSALLKLGIESIQIRHPSYGGQVEFLANLAQLYKVSFN